jgi:hypothetical protein
MYLEYILDLASLVIFIVTFLESSFPFSSTTPPDDDTLLLTHKTWAILQTRRAPLSSPTTRYPSRKPHGGTTS